MKKNSRLSFFLFSSSFSATMKLAAAPNARAAVAARTSSVRAAAATPAAASPAPSRRSVGAALFAAVPAVMLFAAAQPGEF